MFSFTKQNKNEFCTATNSPNSQRWINVERPISRLIFIPGNGKFRECNFHSREFPGNGVLLVKNEKKEKKWKIICLKNFAL